MRLDCHVMLQSTAGDQRNRRPVKGIVSLGSKKLKGSDTQVYQLQISTPADRNQTPIEISSSTVERVMPSFIGAGRFTIIFRSAANSLFISRADPDKLRRFAETLVNIINKHPVDLNSNTKVKTTDFDQPRTLNLASSSMFAASLEEIVAKSMKLKTLDPRMFSCPRLTKLDLSDNHLGHNVNNFGRLRLISRLKQLRHLDLSANEISSIPVDILFPVTLIQLNLSKNQLTRIPSNLFRLVNLRSLDLSDNMALTDLPAELAALPISVLDVRQTLISYIHFAFTTRVRFESLQLGERRAVQRPQFGVYGKVDRLVNLATAAHKNNGGTLKEMPWDVAVSANVVCKVCNVCLKWVASRSLHRRLFTKAPLDFANQVDDNTPILVFIRCCGECLPSVRHHFDAPEGRGRMARRLVAVPG